MTVWDRNLASGDIPQFFSGRHGRNFGVGDLGDPSGRVVSTHIAHDPGKWVIMHTLANGTVVDRSLQYVIIDQPCGSQWRGTLIRNPSMTMIDEVMRLKSNWQPTYNEWLYQDGQLVMHSMALCEDKPVTATQSNTTVAAPAPAQSAPQTGKQTVKRIPLRLSGNNYIVPVLINGRIWLDFMLDTGASDVTIPVDVAKTLMRAGTITKEDIGGEKNYELADGGTVTNTQFRIHSLQIGEGDNAVIAQNVDGSVSGSQGSLLLGGSFLRRFRSTTIDQ